MIVIEILKIMSLKTHKIFLLLSFYENTHGNREEIRTHHRRIMPYK